MNKLTVSIEQMASNNISNRKILSMMRELYGAANAKPIEVDLTEMCKVYHIGAGIGTELLRSGVVVKFGRGIYQWIGEKPDILFADEIRKKMNISATESKLAKMMGTKYRPKGTSVYAHPFREAQYRDRRRLRRSVTALVVVLIIVALAVALAM